MKAKEREKTISHQDLSSLIRLFRRSEKVSLMLFKRLIITTIPCFLFVYMQLGVNGQRVQAEDVM